MPDDAPALERPPEVRPSTPAPLDWLRPLVTCVQPASREAWPVQAPFDGTLVGTVPRCTEADVAWAFRRAREAQAAWAAQPVRQRAAVLLRLHDLILKAQASVLNVIQAEAGKARIHGFEEIIEVALSARHYGLRAPRLLRTQRRRGLVPGLTAVREHRVPTGVVGLIAPWNYPLAMTISDALPALVAGNAVVVKPAEETPFTALLGKHLLREAGVPPEVFQVVTGLGEQLGPSIIREADVVAFTGSSETGRLIGEQAGAQLTKCSLELGGKNALLVLDDADLAVTADGAVRACFANAGQLCVATERLYVPRAHYDAFLTLFKQRTEALRLSSAFTYTADIGSLISADQFAKVHAHVTDAVARGATVVTGGHPRPDLGPYFYAPTVLTDVTPAMRVAQEETFGPVVSVYPYDTLEAALEAINDTPFGLNASIWTRRPSRGQAVAARVQCGTVNVNDGYSAAYASVDAPMGGMKTSGLGRRHGAEGLLKFTEAQTVAVQRGLPLAPPPGVSVSLFTRGVTAGLRLVRHLPGLR
ncbi:MAG: succinic semialdehyde dehydrogenase [Bacteroidota bacterium]